MTHEVTVYTKDDCQPCKATKIYLMKFGVPFTEINLSRNPLILEALVEQGYSSVPVVEWTNGAWSGFEPERIEELAELIKTVQ